MATGKTPSPLATAEREEAALREKQARLRAMVEAGKITEEEYMRRHRSLLERQTLLEHALKGLRLVAEWEADEEAPPARAERSRRRVKA